MSDITHRLVGYDRETERVVDEYDVPDDLLPQAKNIAHVPVDDPEAAMCYQLAENEARDLAGFLRASIDPARRDYFLEGFAITE
jgi:hypothetical protein